MEIFVGFLLGLLFPAVWVISFYTGNGPFMFIMTVIQFICFVSSLGEGLENLEDEFLGAFLGTNGLITFILVFAFWMNPSLFPSV